MSGGAKVVQSASEFADTLDTAGQTILGLLHRAADAAEANNQRALEVAQKLSTKLRAAENRIKELEEGVRYYQDRADRAERWLRQIAAEIEQKLLNAADKRPQPPPPQALLSIQRR